MSGFLSIFNAISPLLERIFNLIPDPNARAKAQQELTTLLIETEAKERVAQVELNKIEASHKSIFVAGWRPFIGWVGGVSLLWTFLLQPLMTWTATVLGYTGDFPVLNTDGLMTLVMAMLGIGAMRSFDKLKGNSTEVLGQQPKPARKPSKKELDIEWNN